MKTNQATKGVELGDQLLRWEKGEPLSNKELRKLYDGLTFLTAFLRVTREKTGAIIYREYGNTLVELDRVIEARKEK